MFVAMFAALGSRFGWWDYNFAVIILKWAAYAGAVQFWYAPNSRVYGRFETDTFQKEFYPEIKPLIISLPANQVFDLCLKVIRKKGWKLWQPDRAELHIEATATTFWFGFNDDVVIHIIRLGENKSKIDVRSASRVSGGDGGTNAKRILAFFKPLKNEADKIISNN